MLAAQLAGYHHDTSDAATLALRDDEGLDPIGRIGGAIVHLHDAYAALNTASSAARAYQPRSATSGPTAKAAPGAE